MGLMFPKSVKVQRLKPLRYTNPKHLDWIHDWSCALAGKCECDGPVVAHHLLNPWIGMRGMGRKADDRNVIAICDGHHRELHARGDEDSFWKEQAGYPEFGRIWSEKLWLDSPYYEVVRG
jgi:hypothetical protein